jgi:hypothetical protein
VKIARYTFAEPCDRLMATLERIRTEDKRAERTVGASCGLAFVFFLIAGIGFMASSPVVLMAAVVLFVVALIASNRAQQHDLEDRKYEVPLHFLRVVAADTSPGTPLRLDVDFQRYNTPANLKRSGIYLHSWLALRGRLADGTRFAFEVTACVKRKEKSKRRGTRVSERIRETVVMTLAFSPDRYPSAAVIERELRALPPPPGLSLTAFCLSGKNSLRATLTLPPCLLVNGHGTHEGQVTGDTLLTLLVWAYRAARGAKAAGLAAVGSR